jgi:hypothetical protein
MAFEDKKAELELLLESMRNAPEDVHELHQQILQKFNELKAFGMPLPADLVRLEAQLAASFSSK